MIPFAPASLADLPAPETGPARAVVLTAPSAMRPAPAPEPVPEPAEAPVPRPAHHPFWLGLRLVALKRITPEQLASARLEFQRRPAEGFAAALERLSLTSQKVIAQLTAEHHGLAATDIPPGAVPVALATRLGAIRARNHAAVPLCDEDGVLTIAVADPARYTQEEAGQDFPGRRLRFVVAPRNDILSAIDAAHTPPLPATNPKELLAEILTDAVAKRASDVHFEPKPNDLHVRYRIDNSMLHRDALGTAMKPAIIQAIKSLARLDISQTRLPLDGQARLSLGASTYNLRISTLPTVRGEKAVIRIQDETRNFGSLAELGLSEEQIALFVRLISVPNGVFYITGPTGSGKTTLQYALLATQDLSGENVVTLEDPVEYQIYSYNQCAVNEGVGRTFEVMLRAVMRQDPDVVLIGETRDRESARIAIHAALTGHRVFSTLHTNDAPAAAARLIDIGIEPYLVASAVKAVCGTRLVERLCACARPVAPPQLAYLTREFGAGAYREPVGCPLCAGTGYRGRLAILEIFPLTDEHTQQLILRKVPTSELAAHLRSLGYPNMRDDGLAKARSGITTVQQVLAQV